MNEKRKDFIKYLIFLAVQIGLCFLFLYFYQKKFNGTIILKDVLLNVGVSIFLNVLMIILFLVMIYFETTIRFKLFTFVYFFFSAGCFFDCFKDKEAFKGMMAISFLAAGLFSILVLWKYNKKNEIEKK